MMQIKPSQMFFRGGQNYFKHYASLKLLTNVWYVVIKCHIIISLYCYKMSYSLFLYTVVKIQHNFIVLYELGQEKNASFNYRLRKNKVWSKDFFYFDIFFTFETDETDFSWKCKQRLVTFTYNMWHLQVYNAVLKYFVNLVKMLWHVSNIVTE